MENKLKHLEFIQLVITRMNVNSFLTKGWAVTMAAALFAFASKDTFTDYVCITYLSTIMFWLLDSYYLSQERQYRTLYDEVIKKRDEDIDFDMNARKYNLGRNTWACSALSPTILLFYGVLIGLSLIVMFVIN